MLDVDSVSKSFELAGGRLDALAPTSFRVESGQFVAVVGPSGCGKTTLLRILAGIEEATSGAVTVVGARTGFVFQRHGLFPWMSVRDNIAFGLQDDRTGLTERVAKVVADVGLSGFEDFLPHRLSGGMQQRVNLGRAMVRDPDLLLMDEPFGSLDDQTRHLLQDELLRVWNRDRRAVVFVTHDIEEAVLLADRVLVMNGRPGRVVEQVDVPLDRPRDLTGRSHPEAAELRWHIWELIRDEASGALRGEP